MDLKKIKNISVDKKPPNFFSGLILKIFKISDKRNKFDKRIKNFLRQTVLDKKLVYSLTGSKTPNFRQLKYIGKYLNTFEHWAIFLSLGVIIASTIFLSYRFYSQHLETAPAQGGEYIEGLIGSPKYINPLYSIVSDADNDIASLIYSSLFKRGNSAELVNDLAENYIISQDNKDYTVKIKPNIKWHNGSPLTAEDVVFTFNAIKDNQYNSPLRASFSGVEIEKIDDLTVKFILSEPYAAFLDLLTFGISPAELWSQIPPTSASLAELNLKPIGSGPFKYKSLIKDKSGNIRSYSLIRNDNYYSDKPFLNIITFKFFVNNTELVSALNDNLVDGISYLPMQLKSELIARDSLNIFNLNMPQLTAIFFNSKNNNYLASLKVRRALTYSLDKNSLVKNNIGQDVRLLDGPIFPDSFAHNQDIKKYNYDLATSTKLLDDDGWKVVQITAKDIEQANLDLSSKDEEVKKQAQIKIAMGEGTWRFKNNNYLVIELTTADAPDYMKLAEEIAKFWQAVNVKTVVNIISANQIQSDIIRQRDFQALLYGELVGADPDPYAYWHSSQISESGLNISNYSNKEVDKLLEDARLTNDINIRKEKYKRFQEIIADDLPAIFLYSPNYTYIQSKKIKGFMVKTILIPRDRLANIDDWYIKTGEKLVW